MHFALIGEHIAYSYSPRIHDAIFKELGVDADYRLMDFPFEAFDEKLAEIKGLDGFNVTKPHKQAVLGYLSGAYPPSVNTVRVENGKLYGYSTDGAGLIAALDRHGFVYQNKTVLVLGAGGAGLAVASALKETGARVVFFNRTAVKAEAAAKSTGVDWADDIRTVNAYGIVNATTCGYKENENPLPEGLDLSGISWAYDMIYNPAETAFMRSFSSRGIPSQNGLYMLIFQAIAADEIFLGRAIPPPVRERILNKIIPELIKGEDK